MSASPATIPFRVYPPGVTADQTSQRLQGLAVMRYLLGLSYGAVTLALEALGVDLSKTSVYRAVQAAATAVPDLYVSNGSLAGAQRRHWASI